MVRSKRKRHKRVEEDPMAGTANLVDAMLVLAVGFLIFVVMSWNMQSIIFSDMSQDCPWTTFIQILLYKIQTVFLLRNKPKTKSLEISKNSDFCVFSDQSQARLVCF
jgi:hypothetical protein